jgi:hypothetical protein
MKTYSITIIHNDLQTTTHNFKTLLALNIFSNLIESEAWISIYGLDSFYDIEKEINKLFYYYPESVSEWEWILNVADYDYLLAWERFCLSVEQNEIDYQADWQIKSNEQHLTEYVPF